jgi:cysteinyl-tRNA synthetase
MAKYWLHNGLMQASHEVGKVGGRNTREAASGFGLQASGKEIETDPEAQLAGKISKSKGSSAFRDLLQQFAPETIRFFLLSSHYRRPIDYSIERLQEVETGLDTFYRFFRRFARITGELYYALEPPTRRMDGDYEPKSNELVMTVAEQRNRFLEAMDDDFNTGAAIGVLFDLLRLLNKYADDNKLEGDHPDQTKLQVFRHGAYVLRELTTTLGLFQEMPGEQSDPGDSALVGRLMTLLIELRASARETKDFATADKIRKELAEMGITLEDRPSGTEWSWGT